VTVLHSELPVGLIAAEIYFISVTVNKIVVEDYQVLVNSCLLTLWSLKLI
jgi:hypothetical protein